MSVFYITLINLTGAVDVALDECTTNYFCAGIVTEPPMHVDNLMPIIDAFMWQCSYFVVTYVAMTMTTFFSFSQHHSKFNFRSFFLQLAFRLKGTAFFIKGIG